MELATIPLNKPAYELEEPVAWCEYCGKPGYVETHHIKTRGTGGKDILLNRIRLCPEHHRAAQEYKIDRLVLVQIVARREKTTPEEVCRAIEIPVPDKFPPLSEKEQEPGIEELIQAYISLDEQEIDIKWTKAQLLDALLSTGVSVKWLASQLNVSVSFIRKYVKVYKAFPEESMRIPGLKFEHHNIALTSKKDPYEILARAADEHLSTRQMRKLIIEEEASDEFKDIAKKEEADEIQEAKKVYAKVESVIAKGGPGAEWLREKLIELVG
ncbi:MAG TPA: HNH endonuclease signature motif containing protein [Bacillota bacterium]|nr:HNH endonuclease signature motif containing protein [Bacillota bacterium]